MAERAQILMCRPTQFGVNYVINPWMEGHVGRTIREVAEEQWNRLYGVISRVADVQLVEPGDQLPDMCFTANAGLVLGNQFVPTTFRVRQREPEVPLYTEWFRQAGYAITQLDSDVPFEGEGDFLFHHLNDDTPVWWAGYGVRSSLESHRSIGALCDIEVISLRLVDQRFYHLDTCFMPLPEGRVLYYPAAFDERSLREIRRRVPAEHRLRVDKVNAMQFACNALVLDGTVVTNFASAALQEELAAWGFTVVVSPVNEFLLAGGAVKCLSLVLHRPLKDVGEIAEHPTAIRSTHVDLAGHLLDSGLMNRLFDVTFEAGGEATVESLAVAPRHDQLSRARVRVTAPNEERLELITNQLMPLGARLAAAVTDARLEQVTQAGVAPTDFYSTTIYPTEVRVDGRWRKVARQRMDAVILIDPSGRQARAARCCLIRDLQPGDLVVCGVDGVRIDRPPARRHEGEFAFMSSGVSSERRVELAVDQLAWEMKRIRGAAGSDRVRCRSGRDPHRRWRVLECDHSPGLRAGIADR